MDNTSVEREAEAVERELRRVKARRPAPKTRECAGCGGAFRGRDLHEVDDDNLTLHGGDEVCARCATDYRVL